MTGIEEIEHATWVKDEWGTLNLHVTDAQGHDVHAFLTLRPEYCDRGHIKLNIDGNLNLDDADSFPRFFFSFEEADIHTRTFLKWRLWKQRTHRHTLESDNWRFDAKPGEEATRSDINAQRFTDAWLVTSEKGSTHMLYALDIERAEDALETHYVSMESCVPFKRDKMIRVTSVINMARLDIVNEALMKSGYKIVPCTDEVESNCDDVGGNISAGGSVTC